MVVDDYKGIIRMRNVINLRMKAMMGMNMQMRMRIIRMEIKNGDEDDGYEEDDKNGD